MTAQDRYRRMLKDEIAPALRGMGVRGSGASFRLPDPHWHLLLRLQASSSSDSTRVRFTVNLAVIDKAVWDAQHQPWWGRPSATAQAPIGQYERLGHLMPARADVWWHVLADASTVGVSADVCQAIREYGLPALRDGELGERPT